MGSSRQDFTFDSQIFTAMEEDESRVRSLQRPISTAGGVNPLRKRGSAIAAAARPPQPPPPPPQSSAPPPGPPPPPPPPPPAAAGHSPEDDLVRASVALSFSGLYPNRLSVVDPDGQGEPMPTIDEDNLEEMDHPLADTTFAIPEPPESAPPPMKPPKQAPPPAPTGPVAMAAINEPPPLPPSPPPPPPKPAVYEAQRPAPTFPPVEYERIGIGWKQCPSVALLWQERFFVLKHDATITYYADRDSYVQKFAPKGVINLRDVQNNPSSRNGIFDSVEQLHDKLNIHVNSKGKRTYKLKFGTAEEAKAWRDAIYNHLKKINL